MEHLIVKAAIVPTDQGVFEAVISTEAIDREKDIVVAQAIVDALRKWNRPIPLAWNHSTEAEDIFGHIDPSSVKEVEGEVVAGGQVDLDSKVGREAWRSFKNRTIGFSFGYLITDSIKRAEGIREIRGLDVFEVSATATPMNGATRVLPTKATSGPVPTDAQLRRRWAELKPSLPRHRSDAELRREFDRHRLDTIMDGVPRHDPAPATSSAADDEPQPVVPTDAELREQAKALGLPVTPPRRRPVNGTDFAAVRAEARGHMLACLRFELLPDERVGNR
jgi:HK97 family phage prohead protease